MIIWSGDLADINGEYSYNSLKDVAICIPSNSLGEDIVYIPENARLHILSLVAISRIPLSVIAGPRFEVHTGDASTQDEFATILFDTEPCERGEAYVPWWKWNPDDCAVGLLAGVRQPERIEHEGQNRGRRRPRVTEVLFYAGYPSPVPGSVFEQVYRVYALPLSSDLLYPPQHMPLQEYPGQDDTHDLSPSIPTAASLADTASAESSRKREVASLFEEAEDRRKRAKRKGGENVAKAAAGPQRDDPSSSSLGGRRIKTDQVAPQETRKEPQPEAHSRSSSIFAESRAAKRAPTAAPNRSSLSRSQSVRLDDTNREDRNSFESRNRDVLSRVVMAAMRLYGLDQQKKDVGVSHQESIEHTAAENDLRHGSSAGVKDEDYKLMYHQTFKSAAFALRSEMTSGLIPPDTLRDTVDKLLAIFCGTTTTF